MKHLLLAVLFVAGSVLSLSAQEKKTKVKTEDVPAAVSSSFKKAFAGASDVKWKEKEGVYKAKFDLNGKKHTAALNASGKLVSQGAKIDKTTLPAVIAKAVHTAYPANTIDDVYKIEEDGKTNYQVKLDGKPERKILYAADGKVLKNKVDD